MSLHNGKLSCDMLRECQAPVSHIDEKGFVYCAAHAQQRKAYRRCRKLLVREVRQLASGLPLGSYRRGVGTRLRDSAPDLLTALKAAQARLCEDCGPRDWGTNSGEHSDECLAAMAAIDRAEGRL